MESPPSNPVRYTFAREERLRSKKLIESLFAGGRIVTAPGLRLHWIETTNSTPVQVAFAVPKRAFRKATDRNLIRRRLREAYRLHKHRVHNLLNAQGKCAALMITFTGKQALEYKEVEDKIILLLQRFTDKLCGKP